MLCITVSWERVSIIYPKKHLDTSQMENIRLSTAVDHPVKLVELHLCAYRQHVIVPYSCR